MEYIMAHSKIVFYLLQNGCNYLWVSLFPQLTTVRVVADLKPDLHSITERATPVEYYVC